MTTASTLLPATYPRFRYDGSGDLARIGLIYIASSVVTVSYTHLTLPTTPYV